MNARSDYETAEARSTKSRRLLRQEELILEVTEALAEALASVGIRKAELASRLGKSKGFVTQILAGGRNLTLRTVADVADALGYQIQVKACRRNRAMAVPLRSMSEAIPWRGEEGWTAGARVVRGDFGSKGKGVAA